MVHKDLEKKDEDTSNFHKCESCNNLCIKKKCQECFVKSIKDKQGECYDCKKLFFAVRIDGTKRKRCLECQSIYNEKHIAKCPICNNDYHAFLHDGRFFDKCYTCYQYTLRKCDNCDKKTSINQPLCKDCYNLEKINSKSYLLSYSPTSSTSAEFSFKQLTKTCKNKDCNNHTTFSYCKQCYDNYKTSNVFSECTNCSWKFRGTNTLCNRCS